MLAYLTAVGVWAVPPAALTPQFDFASLPPPGQRAKSFAIDIEVRLASGNVEEYGLGVGAATAQEACDDTARWFGAFGWGYHLDGLKLTLVDVRGDPVVGVTVRSKGPVGGTDFVPQLAVNWVARTPPKVTWTYLAPAGRGGPSLPRGLGSMFSGAVSAVAAPELDFAGLPDAGKGPRLSYIWLHTRLASGRWASRHLDWQDGGRGHLRAQAPRLLDTWYDLKCDPLGTKLGLLEFFHETGENGFKADGDRVVGLTVEANGPTPTIGWTLRPEARKLLNLK